jgi:hypothetical protein
MLSAGEVVQEPGHTRAFRVDPLLSVVLEASSSLLQPPLEAHAPRRANFLRRVQGTTTTMMISTPGRPL